MKYYHLMHLITLLHFIGRKFINKFHKYANSCENVKLNSLVKYLHLTTITR